MADPTFEQRLVLGMSASQIKAMRLKQATEGKSPKQLLEIAGSEGCACRILYQRLDHQTEERFVDPYEWRVTGGADDRSEPSLKLFAYCRTHHETHSFIQDNILHVELKPNLKRVAPFPYTGPKHPSVIQGTEDYTTEELASMAKSMLEGGGL